MPSSMRPACGFANCLLHRSEFSGDCTANRPRLQASYRWQLRSHQLRATNGKIHLLNGVARSQPSRLSVRRQSASRRPCCHGDQSRRSRGRMRRPIRKQPSPAAGNWPRSAIARCAIPMRTARSTPEAARSGRHSARSTRPTSRPISKPASAHGPIPPSSARCARAFIATEGIFIRRFPTHISPRRLMPICRRSMPT